MSNIEGFDSCFAYELGQGQPISLRIARYTTERTPEKVHRYLGVLSLGQESKSVRASDIAATLDIAPEFSSIVSYTKDDFVYRDGRFYCAKKDIPAGAWNSSNWIADPSLSSILLQKIRAIIPSTSEGNPGDVLSITANGQGIEWAPGGSDVTIDTVVVGAFTDQNNEAILDSNNEPISDSSSVELVEKINDTGILASRAMGDEDGNNIKSTYAKKEEILPPVIDGGTLTDATSITVENNALSRLSTSQSALTLNVNLAAGEVANFAVEIAASANVTLAVTSTVGGVTTTLKKSAAGGDSLESGKFYQMTCVGSCWTLAEFDAPSA